MIKKRKGYEFVTAIPTKAGAAISMCEYKGRIILACQFCIYELSPKKIFKQIKFEIKP